MKKSTTLGLGVVLLLFLSFLTANAQPANDNVCDALLLTPDDAPVTSASLPYEIRPIVLHQILTAVKASTHRQSDDSDFLVDSHDQGMNSGLYSLL